MSGIEPSSESFEVEPTEESIFDQHRDCMRPTHLISEEDLSSDYWESPVSADQCDELVRYFQGSATKTLICEGGQDDSDTEKPVKGVEIVGSTEPDELREPDEIDDPKETDPGTLWDNDHVGVPDPPPTLVCPSTHQDEDDFDYNSWVDDK